MKKQQREKSVDFEERMRKLGRKSTGGKKMNNEFKLHEDLDMFIRSRYKVPKQYATYKLESSYIRRQLEEKIESKRFIKKLFIESKNKIVTGFDTSLYSAYIKGTNFMLISEHEVNLVDDSLHYLFIEPDMLSDFFNEYIKDSQETDFEQTLTSGVYSPVYEMLEGWKLSPVSAYNLDAPILNEDLEIKLIDEINSFLKNEEIYKKINTEYKRGILLFGPPGNGKTSFIKNLINKVDAISILTNSQNPDALNYIGSFIGDAKHKDILKIIIIEDIDGLDSMSRSKLLNFLDGVEAMNKVIFIATTNYPERLDIAITRRPSRFDSIYKIDLPNEKSRKKLFLRFFENIDKKELDLCIKESKGMSGAYFKELYIFSQLNNITPSEALDRIQQRLKELGGGTISNLGTEEKTDNMFM